MLSLTFDPPGMQEHIGMTPLCPPKQGDTREVSTHETSHDASRAQDRAKEEEVWFLVEDVMTPASLSCPLPATVGLGLDPAGKPLTL